jgi:uncharacterized protein YidB (DUF937 family)
VARTAGIAADLSCSVGHRCDTYSVVVHLGGIGPDVLAALEQQTGLLQEELLARLSRELPSAVDQYTPDGRIPA